MRLSVDKVAKRMRKMREDHACEKAGVPVWGADGFIAHAGGGYEGEAYTNSREALTRSLQAGALAIEMDFMFTTDDVLVCEHGWKDNGRVPMDSESFLSQPGRADTTHITARDALELFCGNDRAYLIIDSQEKDLARVHTRIRAILEDMGRLDFIDRIVPEIYFEREYEAVKAVSPYQHWLLSLYKHKELDETVYADIVDFCASHGVKVLTMGKKRANRQRSYIANKKGLTVAVHTVNTKKGWQQLRDAGARLAFTDKLYPKFDA